ncbi:nuclear transport factor 2 family protein [Actinomadura sp. ATCC 31491]|uniref:Nuclear transport factor 2 family protein n=1 Tax=Actinomadura luzonensis TaxID=2805427 RepID=A0ABT0FK12_9ACTN|nr:nuclear transport factor 2 family protein [Actinomadura luzonensis]MCK2212538.1 nuclear transport factor 2 family protein [Actinomadura luzonensis]
MTSPENVFDRQLAAIAAQDLQALLAQYHPEAEVVRFDRVARGPAEIEELFAAYLKAGPHVDELVSVRTTGDVILYHARMTVGGNRVATYGTLVLRDGLIWRQTAAAQPLGG